MKIVLWRYREKKRWWEWKKHDFWCLAQNITQSSVSVHRGLTFHSHGSAGAPWTSNSISWWRSSAYAWRVWYLAAASHRTPAGPPSCSPVHTAFRTSWSYVQNNTNIEPTATESLHGTWRQAPTGRRHAVKRSATKTELSAALSFTPVANFSMRRQAICSSAVVYSTSVV